MEHVFSIPAYGQSPHLAGCIESILNQRGGVPRVLLTTSTPNAFLEQMAARYRLDLRVNPRRANIAADWNFALECDDSARVTIAHQDDRYHPGYLEAMGAALARHPGALIAFSAFDELSDAGPRPSNRNLQIKRLLSRHAFGQAESIASDRAKRRLLAWGNPVCCPSVVFNRSRLAGFRFGERLKTNLDWEAWLALSRLPGDFVYVRECLVSKRVHAASETSALIADRTREQEDRYMFEQFWPRPFAAFLMRAYRLGYLANAG